MTINEKYEEFYRRGNNSKAFSKFCISTFGIDLSQDGFADKEQMDLMIEFADINNNDICLDIGCGNGRIDEYINIKTNAHIHGIDYSKSAISYAKNIGLTNKDLEFTEGDINNLKITSNKYNKILLIDSIYFSDDYSKTLLNLYSSLKLGGTICLCYSEFVFDKMMQNKKIESDETKIAEEIMRNDWQYRSVDLINSHFNLMKRKNIFSTKYKDDFNNENNTWLYEKLHIESVGDDCNIEAFSRFTNRYIYCIYKNK